MNIADELQKLQALRESGALTDAEFAEVKLRVLCWFGYVVKSKSMVQN